MVLAKNLPESTKIQHHAVIVGLTMSMKLGHPAPCKVSLSVLYSTESIKIQQNQPLEFDGFGVGWGIALHGEKDK